MATAGLAGTRAPAQGTNAPRRGEDDAPGDDDQGGRRLAGDDESWLQVRSQRGRFYLERPLGEGDSGGVEAWGRITPLADSADLFLEQEGRKGSWSEIARGSARKLIKTVASDTKGTFHGLGALDKVLRRAGKGLERLQVKREGTTFVYAGSGE